MTEPSIGFRDPADFERARELLKQVNYTPTGLGDTLGRAGTLTARAADMPLWLRRTAGDTPLETLIRLFLLGVPVTLDRARRALAPMAVQTWVEAGLLAQRDEQVVPLVQVQTHRGLWLISDIPRHLRVGAQEDFVMGVARSSQLLANSLVHRPSRRTLDIGTGGGIQALLCTPHSERIIATDLNPRAVDFARFNARLNGVARMACQVGSLFEPVAGQRFDHVVCNAPYVISPKARYMFCDSGMRGDAFCRRIIQEAPAFLEEGGYFQMVGNWVHGKNQSWRDGLAHWFDGLGCDVLVLGGSTEDAASYATTWILDTIEEGQQGRHVFDEWMDYYEREGIEAISYGVITLRRRAGHNWIRLDDAPERMINDYGESLLRHFQAQNWLHSATVEEFLRQRPRCAPALRFEQMCRPTGEGWVAIGARLILTQGLAYACNVDSYIAALVGRCGGKLTLRELLVDLATEAGIDTDRLIEEALPLIRHLLRYGFLLPEGVEA